MSKPVELRVTLARWAALDRARGELADIAGDVFIFDRTDRAVRVGVMRQPHGSQTYRWYIEVPADAHAWWPVLDDPPSPPQRPCTVPPEQSHSPAGAQSPPWCWQSPAVVIDRRNYGGHMRLLEMLRAQFAELADQARAMTDTVADEGRDLTDAESANLQALNDQMQALQPRIEQQVSLARSMGATADLLSGVPTDNDDRIARLRTPHRVQSLDRFRSLGEFAAARARGDVTREVVEDYQRALVDVTTADVPGITPPAWLRDIVLSLQTARPFVSAFSNQPLPPSGMTVQYPTVTTKPLVGPQAAEKTDIASRKTHIDAEVANVETYGGGEDVSVQVLQRTDPSYLALMLDLYTEQMAIQMDTAAINAAHAALPVPNKDIIYLGTDPAGYNAALIAGAKVVLQNGGRVDTMVGGLNVWEAFAGAVDSEGRPLFPHVNASNPVGRVDITGENGEARGLGFVVDPNMNPNWLFIGWARGFLSMLGGLQTLSADNPAKLGKDYAVFEFAAFAPRRPETLVLITAGADPTP